MPQSIDPTYKQTEVQPCSICHQPRRCRRVRKPKQTARGIEYIFIWLCEICVYGIEII